jgi:hypothetical protein
MVVDCSECGGDLCGSPSHRLLLELAQEFRFFRHHLQRGNAHARHKGRGSSAEAVASPAEPLVVGDLDGTLISTMEK